MGNTLSINIPSYYYPLAEMCVVRLRLFYPPHVPIYVTLNPSESNRQAFFDRLDVQTVYLEMHNHEDKLNSMIEKCNTDIFVSCDDDAFMFRHGAIESIMSLMVEDQLFAVGEVQGVKILELDGVGHDGIVMGRFDPAFLALRTNVFRDKGMTFKRRWVDDVQNPEPVDNSKTAIYFDTAGFILTDVLRYGLRFHDFNYHQFVKHYGAFTYMVFEHTRVNLMNGVDMTKSIPKLSRDMFDCNLIHQSRHADLDRLIVDNHRILSQLESLR